MSEQPKTNVPLPTLPGDALDPANQSLADALRKSFAVLKALMLVLVVAYALSGWFRVQPGEVGFVVRLGRVVSQGPSGILRPGWHWAFPYPIDQVITVATQKERALPVHFLFQLSDEDKVRGPRRIVYSALSPMNDDYLLTGDLSILHAQMLVRYRITDPVSYIGNIQDMTPGDENPAEYEILRNLVRDSAISVAVRTPLGQIYGSGQSAYLEHVAEESRSNLEKLEKVGLSTGIEIIGVIAPQIAGVEAILPPRQTREAFDEVVSSDQKRSKVISDAQGKASELLRQTAGGGYEEIATAIEAEFDALLAYLRAERATDDRDAKVAAAHAELTKRGAESERLLLEASGDVQQIVNDARSERDRIISEAIADAKQVEQLEEEYHRNGEFLMSRLRTEFTQQILSGTTVRKWWVPPGDERIWFQIPTESEATATDRKQEGGGSKFLTPEPQTGYIDRTPLRNRPAKD